jgi:hypothetical protein
VEVWIDGNKMGEQLKPAFSYYTFLDASYNLAAGKHNVTVYSAGWDNLLESQLPVDGGRQHVRSAEFTRPECLQSD